MSPGSCFHDQDSVAAPPRHDGVMSGGGISARRQGSAAEFRALRHLRWRAWRICALNWVGGGGELDIVASRWRTLLIVEVRSRPTLAEAFASIDRDKLDRTLRAAAALVRSHGLQAYRMRLDAIAYDATGRMERRCDLMRVGQPGW